MLARTDTIKKWTMYALATLLCIMIQGAFLQRMHLWGVIPFLYPLLAAIPATFESPGPGTIFAICVGVVCDSLLPAPIPCFYTLSFTLAGLCGSLLSQSLLPAGFLCSLAASAAAFVLTGCFHGFLLLLTGQPAWGAVVSLCLREMLISLPLCFPLTLLYRAVFLKTHLDI